MPTVYEMDSLSVFLLPCSMKTHLEAEERDSASWHLGPSSDFCIVTYQHLCYLEQQFSTVLHGLTEKQGSRPQHQTS